MEELEMDPKGYFLIKVEDKKIAVGFCHYNDIEYADENAKFGKNKVSMEFSSEEPEDILDWIKENKLTTISSHYEYMERELKKAKNCIFTNEKYVQS